MAPAQVGFLVYSGVIPLIKTYLTIICGYILARANLFPPAASRGASRVTLSVALPALIFSSIVPAFNPTNISAIGPLLLSAFVYQGIGFILGLVIREVCYVPRNFYQGILVLMATSNWGNLPTAVVLTVTQRAPFNPSTDPALAVSFVAIYIFVLNLTFWGFGAGRSLSWDYLPNVPQGVEAERRLSWKEKPIAGWICNVLGRKPVASGIGGITGLENEKMPEGIDPQRTPEPVELPSEPSCVHDDARVEPESAVPFPESPTTQPTRRGLETLSHIRRRVVRIFRALAVLVTPATLSLAISIPIALIQPLKALFVDTTSTGGPNWKAPDGRPPLHFVMDTTVSLGGVTVPMGLILLGVSFARLSMPRPLSRLAIPAMLAAALAKMLVIPLIGIFMVQAMVQGGLIPRESKAERFVAIFLAGTPASVNQLVVSQLYAPEGKIDTLSAFLLVQYVLMFFASAALIAIALALL